MHDVFNIETGFHGTLISAFARLNMDHVVNEVNDETLDPWAELQNAAGISQSTPLSPFMEKELLKDTDLSMDGSAFEKDIGFKYVFPNHASLSTNSFQVHTREAHKRRRRGSRRKLQKARLVAISYHLPSPFD
jgi:hypothetical protein